MARPKNPVPTYRPHEQSGQAVVTLNLHGAREGVLLGKYGSPRSRQEYERVPAQLRAAAAPTAAAAGPLAGPPDLAVNELLVASLGHAERHYRRADGAQTDEVYNFKLSLRPVREL